MIRIRILFLSVLLLALPSGQALAAPPGQARAVQQSPARMATRAHQLRIRVMNYSLTPHRPVTEVAVVLSLRHAGHVRRIAEGRTDARGSATISAPPLSRGASYIVSATYRSVTYDIVVSVPPGVRPVELRVYDTTASDATLAAMRVIVGARRTRSGLGVIESWTYTNVGSLTDIGSGGRAGHHAATFPMPPGATNVAIRDVGPSPATATIGPAAITVDTIVRPATGLDERGFHQLTFTFNLPTGPGHPTLVIPTNYYIGSLDVFSVGSRLVAPGFKETMLQIGGRGVRAWEKTAVQPGSAVAVGVDGPPASAAPSLTVPDTFPTLPVAVMAMCGFVLVLLLGALGRAQTVALPAGSSARTLRQERARLIVAIAELDLQHARGHVASSQYRRQRARDKSRVLDLSRRLE